MISIQKYQNSLSEKERKIFQAYIYQYCKLEEEKQSALKIDPENDTQLANSLDNYQEEIVKYQSQIYQQLQTLTNNKLPMKTQPSSAKYFLKAEPEEITKMEQLFRENHPQILQELFHLSFADLSELTLSHLKKANQNFSLISLTKDYEAFLETLRTTHNLSKWA
jgi:ABC-type Zn uptake system ZnuABC Zn-binding protein ZnuA